jgi:transketolase
MRNHFKKVVLNLAEKDEKIVLLLGDISVYLLKDFADRYPDRFYNVGICENTLISMAAGMSSQKLHPIVHTIAPFITERCYEQVKLDMCYNRAGGNIVSCGGSFDYAWDGATHHCYTDLELMRMLPGMEVMQPGNKKELGTLIETQYANGNASYFRIPADEHNLDLEVEFGKANVVHHSDSATLTIATAGPILKNVFEACQGLDVNLLYFHTIKPLDAQVLSRYADTQILVIHDAFGLFEAISTTINAKVKYYGIPDKFCCFYGTLEDIRKLLGLDAEGIRNTIQKELISELK